MRSPLMLIGESAKLYKKDFAIFIGYSAWLLFPFAILVLFDFLPPSSLVTTGSFILMIAELLLYTWVSIVLVLFAKARIKKETVDPHSLPEQAKQLIKPVLIVAILQFLLFVGGFLLLIIPLFVFFVWFGLAQFTTIFEGKHGLESLGASRVLAKGRFWKTAGYLIVGPVVLMLVYSLALAFVMSLIGGVQGLSPVSLLSGDAPLWIDVLESIGQVFYVPLLIVYMTHVYLELSSNEIVESSHVVD